MYSENNISTQSSDSVEIDYTLYQSVDNKFIHANDRPRSPFVPKDGKGMFYVLKNKKKKPLWKKLLNIR